MSGPSLVSAAAIDPLAVDPAMRAWVRERVGARGRHEARARRLSEALLDPSALGLRESPARTVTAREAFHHREANCVGFAFLFVALAREIDLPAGFVLFDDVESWERRGSVRVGTTHMAAAIGNGRERRIVDFGGVQEPPEPAGRPVSDDTARAVLLSNLGVERLVGGRPEAAIEYLERAVALDPDLIASWINLGVAHRRRGDLDRAEGAYRHAIRLDPESVQAWRNLALMLDLRLTAGERGGTGARVDDRGPAGSGSVRPWEPDPEEDP